MYTFSKKAWYVKLYKWVYCVDPTKSFKTMCPYFWSLVFTILLFPIVLIIKLFGKAGTRFLNYLRKTKERNYQIRKVNFLEKASTITTGKEAYLFSKTIDWGEFSHNLGDDYYRLFVLIRDYKIEVVYVKEEEYIENKSKLVNSWVAKSVIPILILTIAALIVHLLIIAPYETIDWDKILGVTIFFIVVILTIGLFIYGLYLISETKTPKTFKYIGKGFGIFYNMVIATYKQYCPIITWKE